MHEVTIPDKVSLGSKVFEYSSVEKIIIETEDESVNFEYWHFGYQLKASTNSYDESLKGTLKIYVKNEVMKNKLEKYFKYVVKTGNVIVGLPQGNE